jgi:glutamyl-tRNA synthetase
MSWLGLDWDGEAHFQSEYADRHAEIAHQLLASGHAYKCWMSQAELAAQRSAAKADASGPRPT